MLFQKGCFFNLIDVAHRASLKNQAYRAIEKQKKDHRALGRNQGALPKQHNRAKHIRTSALF